MGILRKNGLLGVCVHHSVYKPANNLAELKVQAGLFNSWHKSKSWAEDTKTPSAYPYISYHYLMATDGSMLKVTDEKYVKYHAGDNFRKDLSFNLHGIAVCLTGNYENDKPTDAQMKALVLFIRDVEKRYDINARIRGHKETSQTATACPGKNIGTSTSGWLKSVISNVNNKDYPPVVTPPVEPPDAPDCEKYIKQIDTLKKENTDLKTALKSSGEEILGMNRTLDSYKFTLKSKEEKIVFLETNLKESSAENEQLKQEVKESEEKYATLMINYKTLVNTNAEVVKELAECKQGKSIIKEFVEWISNLFKKE